MQFIYKLALFGSISSTAAETVLDGAHRKAQGSSSTLLIIWDGDVNQTGIFETNQ